MRTTRVFGTIVLVVLVLALALMLPFAVHAGSSATSVGTSTESSSTTTSSSTTSSTTTVVTPGQTSTFADSQHGLQLRLSISTDLAITGANVVSVNVSEFNTLSGPNNVTMSSQWQTQAALSSCPNTNFQPFGIAVYLGHFTAQNVSQGSQLQIFPITACPMYIRLITGYLFQPNSDVATVLPGSGPTPMTASVDINGTYSGLGQSLPLNPGTYTVVAADEWGALAFLYFEVSAPLPS
jgi:hypothetical protein